jgi:hypothetical protein
MKRLMVANKQKNGKSRYFHERMETLLKAQIDNMLELGWEKKNIILLTNFDFEFMGIKAEVIKLNDFCLSGSKMWSMSWLFDNKRVDDVIFSSDLDCWQNCWFDPPIFDGDVGACCYSNPKFNGGSIFWKPESRDIVNKVVEVLIEKKAKSEEPTLNEIFKSEKYRDRISILNSTYNVGCSGFAPRYERSIKPVHVCHFHPNNNIAWEIHGLDREGLGEIAVTVRLERLLRKYYPNLATELKDKSVQQQKREQREEKERRRRKKGKGEN